LTERMVTMPISITMPPKAEGPVMVGKNNTPKLVMNFFMRSNSLVLLLT
jgi:hypothetical protein